MLNQQQIELPVHLQGHRLIVCPGRQASLLEKQYLTLGTSLPDVVPARKLTVSRVLPFSMRQLDSVDQLQPPSQLVGKMNPSAAPLAFSVSVMWSSWAMMTTKPRSTANLQCQCLL